MPGLFSFNFILHDTKTDYDTLQVPKGKKPGESLFEVY